MRVIVYVEGPSDRLAMEELLMPLTQGLAARGIGIQFIQTDGKQRLLRRSPLKALNILRNEPDAVVIALPDLYPPDIVFPHRTPQELQSGLSGEFRRLLSEKHIDDSRLCQRFQVFCFKHDLEALVLAAEIPLASRLGVNSLNRTWVLPVENQDHGCPPKRVVEDLFEAQQDRYRDTIDAPLILGSAHYDQVAAACPQCFKPFVDFLMSLPAVRVG